VFGSEIVKDGAVDRKALGAMVFKNKVSTVWAFWHV
jgi:dephospho-CoA kinase